MHSQMTTLPPLSVSVASLFLLHQDHIDKSIYMSIEPNGNFWTQNVEGLADSEVHAKVVTPGLSFFGSKQAVPY